MVKFTLLDEMMPVRTPRSQIGRTRSDNMTTHLPLSTSTTDNSYSFP